MSDEHQSTSSKGKLKYYAPQADKMCSNCEKLSQTLKEFKENIENRHDTIIEILAEHKVLLNSILKQNAVVDNIMKIFPIQSDQKLKELDVILEAQPDPYIRHMKSLIKGNVERYLYEILGSTIILDFNIDGTHGKKRLRDFKNVYGAIIEAISYEELPDQKLRSALQRQKKKLFKQSSQEKKKNKANDHEKSQETDHEESQENMQSASKDAD